MMTKLLNTGLAASLAAAALVPAAPALAHERDSYGGYARDGYGDRYDGDGYYDRRGYDDRAYRDDHRRHYRPARYRCGSGKGTTGLILGGVLGGLLGRAVAGDQGDRTAGLIIGGGAGALAGRAIDRSDDRCRR